MISFEGWDREYLLNVSDYQALFGSAMSSGEDSVDRLEKSLAKIANRSFAVTCNNATDALFFSLISCGVGLGDEVLVTDFSFIATASPISMVGAIPIFCDIDLDTYHMSFESIQRMVSDKTKAIIYTHLFGNMSDISDILNFCKERNISFIEDSAQSLGSSLNGSVAGSIGDCSSYSFNSNKVISGISGGGVFLTDDLDKANLVRKLRRHGGNSSNFEMLGRNSKMLPFNAEVIQFRLNKMEEYQAKRQRIASLYDELLQDSSAIIQHNIPGLNHNYHKYTIRFLDKEKRTLLMNALRNNNVSVSIHYERPLSENSMYASLPHRKDECSNSKLVSQTIMSIPIHPWLTEDEIDLILNTMIIIL